MNNDTDQIDFADYDGRSPFYWIVAIANWTAGYFEITVALFLLVRNFPSNGIVKSPVKSAFFLILACGYVVDSVNSIGWMIGDIIDYEEGSVLTVISVLIQWYASFFEGFWELVLACNRCTALAFPVVYKKLWHGYAYTLITVLVLIFPFLCNGYTFFTNFHCRIYFYHDECSIFVCENTLHAAIVTVVTCSAALVIAWYGRLRARKTKRLNRASQMLLIQTMVTATFEVLCALFFAYSSMKTCGGNVFLWEAVSAVFSFFQHYPTLILLFFVSQGVRHDYCKFYRLTFLIRRKPMIQIISKATTVQPRTIQSQRS